MHTKAWFLSALCFAALVGCDDDDGGGGAGAATESRLSECKLVSEGKYTVNVGDSVVSQCQEQCWADATCTELEERYCDRDASDRVRQCQRECLVADCADGVGTFSELDRCDGRTDCADGSDEENCPEPEEDGPEFCEDSGTRIPRTERCNGNSFCVDGTDELDCPDPGPVFTCARRIGTLVQQIPMELVCDLVPQCADGSDEDPSQGCARPICD